MHHKHNSTIPQDASMLCLVQNVLLMKESAEHHASSPSPPRHQYCCSVTQFSIQFLECMPGFPVLFQLLELAQTRVHQVSDAIQPSHPRSSPSLPASILPSIRVFSKESVLHIRWPKYWSVSSSISPSSEYSGLISCRMDWFDLFTIQGTLKSLLQHHSSKASVLS